MEGFSGKWLSARASVFVRNRHCDHTLSILQQHHDTNHQEKIEKHDPLWDYLVLTETSVTHGIDLWMTVATILTTLIMSAIDVHMVSMTCIQKYKPSWSP